MDIVLLEDVKSLGKKGEVVKVNNGYARNFILPKKLGVEATAKNLNDLKLQEGKCTEDRGAEAGRGKGFGRETFQGFGYGFHESGRGRQGIWFCLQQGNQQGNYGSA